MATTYKFKDIKSYSSDEWMANATKKYRSVFDRAETTYIRVEFSFYNKFFDEKDWDAKLTLKAFSINGSEKKELCKLESSKIIKSDENIVFYRDGWGNAKEGTYWMQGEYQWEAYIDDELVGTKKFFVEEVGKVSSSDNPYFFVEHVKLYSGGNDASKNESKIYYKKFNRNNTSYVWVEFKIKIKTSKAFNYELFFNFYDDAGQPKGQVLRTGKIEGEKKDFTYTFDAGWGNDIAGSWKDDKYTIEIVFMDTLVALVPFEVGENSEEGVLQPFTVLEQAFASQPQKVENSENLKTEGTQEEILNEGLAELNALTGMDNVKKEINELVKLVRFYKETGKDVLNKFSLHSIFTGNPGTGKTTVARIVAKIYKGLGLLEKGHLVEVDREALVAGYIGQTAIKTSEKIAEAQGGVLFIDEAYSLANKHISNDFGQEAIQIILKRMEDLRGKFGVIVAGYTDNMSEFIQSNPGLKSRFDRTFHFYDYSSDEMFVIANSIFAKETITLNSDAEAHLKKYFDYLYNNKDKHFGNARTVRQTIAEAIKNQHLRLADMKKEERTEEMLQTLIFEDVKEFTVEDVRSQGSSLGFKIGK